MRTLLLTTLFACPAHEGPIDVVLDGIPQEEAVIEWAGEDGVFEVCTNAVSDPEAVAGCGPYGVGEPGDYTVRVTWLDVPRTQDVTLERDGSYLANTLIVFAAEDWVIFAPG